MAAKAMSEPKRCQARGRSTAEDPKAAAILLREELALKRQGENRRGFGFWAATAAVGRNAMQPEAGACNGERWEYAVNADRQERRALKKKGGVLAFLFDRSRYRENVRRKL
ncbi:MAG: hypothetical protein FJX45_14640 [Alphaproteobacteria bacterium]|nr:hypothetical protein [Alphaproteobacteria bacterium]